MENDISPKENIIFNILLLAVSLQPKLKGSRKMKTNILVNNSKEMSPEKFEQMYKNFRGLPAKDQQSFLRTFEAEILKLQDQPELADFFCDLRNIFGSAN